MNPAAVADSEERGNRRKSCFFGSWNLFFDEFQDRKNLTSCLYDAAGTGTTVFVISLSPGCIHTDIPGSGDWSQCQDFSFQDFTGKTFPDHRRKLAAV